MTRTLSARPLAAILAAALAAAPAPLFAAETDPPATGAAPPASTVSPSPPPAPPAPPASPDAASADAQAPAPTTHVVSYVTGALAVAAAGAGIALGVLALNAKSDFESHPTTSGADAGNNYAAYCDASLGGAVVLAATSLVFFFVEQRAQSDAPSTERAESPSKPLVSFTAAPTLSPHGAGAGATLRF